MNPLKGAGKFFKNLNSSAIAGLATVMSDVALLIDDKGVIRDLAFEGPDPPDDGFRGWLGQSWLDTVTAESRPKIEALLRDATDGGMTRRRQVNHPTPDGADLPVSYAALRVGRRGEVLVVGRNLSATALLQQRLIDAQQSLERDYWRLQHAETRYRLLFQMSSEAVLVVDSATQKIVEANPAAGQHLGKPPRQLVGRAFPSGFDAAGTVAIKELLAAARASSKISEIKARLAEGGDEFLVSASLFSQEHSMLFLVRLAPLRAGADATVVSRRESRLLDVINRAPDGFVVTSLDGSILTANRAFLDLVQLATEEQARGEPLGRWLGRVGVEFGVLLGKLQEHNAVRLFATSLRGEHGAVADVETSAVLVPDGEHPCIGFTVRNVSHRLGEDPAEKRLPQPVDQLTELVGRVPLKELVRESTDMIERLCIEAALELTGDNRASAAEVLGLSRQSLYVKLHRYGLADPSTDKN